MDKDTDEDLMQSAQFIPPEEEEIDAEIIPEEFERELELRGLQVLWLSSGDNRHNQEETRYGHNQEETRYGHQPKIEFPVAIHRKVRTHGLSGIKKSSLMRLVVKRIDRTIVGSIPNGYIFDYD